MRYLAVSLDRVFSCGGISKFGLLEVLFTNEIRSNSDSWISVFCYPTGPDSRMWWCHQHWSIVTSFRQRDTIEVPMVNLYISLEEACLCSGIVSIRQLGSSFY
jgi:hypothetical protein